MTAFLVCQLLQQNNIDPKKVYLRVSKRAAVVGGTSAFLREGLRLNVYDLLAATMLPSGNDAAVTLAEHFGRFLLLERSRINS